MFFCQFSKFCSRNNVVLQWQPTAGGVASVGARVTFSSPDENARAGETAPKSQCQPTLATPLVTASY